MPLPERLRLIGGTGSPYTRKMVSLLRYRHIPYNITWGDPVAALAKLDIAKPKMIFHPTFLFESGAGEIEAVCDSTPIIRRLEERYEGRSVIPTDHALAFINYLIEDFGDEWCTKYMFHYRWYADEDADNAGTQLPVSMNVTIAVDALATFKRVFTDRQVGRLHVVGSNDVTAPIIDASYRRFLSAMEQHLQQQPYILGNRPASCDFALFGQLTQLVGFDPTPRRISHEVSPRTVGWVSVMEDQCGLEPKDGDWNSADNMPVSLKAILNEIGRVYVPALLANARALQAGEKAWETELDGGLWAQKTFPYQVKCLQWIRDEYAALIAADRARVDTVLSGTGCEALFREA